MKTSKQQSASFRRSLHAEKAREAYIAARRGGEFETLTFDEWEPEDLSQWSPTPDANGWQGLGA